MRPGIVEHSTKVGAARIRWVESGSGDGAPIILIHGLGSSIVKWLDTIPYLAAHRRTIALDMPGFGLSSTPSGSYSPPWLAGSVRAFLDALQIDRAVIVGNSLGGLIGAHFAAAWPDRVEAYVGVDPAFPNDGPPGDPKVIAGLLAPTVPFFGPMMLRRLMSRPSDLLVRESLARNFVDPSRCNPETARQLAAEIDMRRTMRDGLVGVTKANRSMMWALTAGRVMTWDLVRGLRVPVLYLWGDKDRLVPLSVGHQAVHETPGAHLVVLDDCGHNPQTEMPEDFAGAVMAFLRARAVQPRA